MSAPQAAEVRGCFIARALLEDEVSGGAWHLFTNAALFSGLPRRICLQIEKYSIDWRPYCKGGGRVRRYSGLKMFEKYAN